MLYLLDVSLRDARYAHYRHALDDHHELAVGTDLADNALRALIDAARDADPLALAVLGDIRHINAQKLRLRTVLSILRGQDDEAAHLIVRDGHSLAPVIRAAGLSVDHELVIVLRLEVHDKGLRSVHEKQARYERLLDFANAALAALFDQSHRQIGPAIGLLELLLERNYLIVKDFECEPVTVEGLHLISDE